MSIPKKDIVDILTFTQETLLLIDTAKRLLKDRLIKEVNQTDNILEAISIIDDLIPNSEGLELFYKLVAHYNLQKRKKDRFTLAAKLTSEELEILEREIITKAKTKISLPREKPLSEEEIKVNQDQVFKSLDIAGKIREFQEKENQEISKISQGRKDPDRSVSMFKPPRA
jgi:hypothetical protein